MNNPEALTLHSVVTVPYGDVGVIPIEQTIQTKGLLSCLGVILVDEKNVALAHIPAGDPFTVVDERIPGYRIEIRRTFEQLTDKLLRMYGNKTTRTHAHIVGGFDQSSEDIVEKITHVLLQWGLRKEEIERWGPHDEETEWDVTVVRGYVFITRKKAYFLRREDS
jgi:chemotaxis receptor (MCP) glutamine deamidase CheD